MGYNAYLFTDPLRQTKLSLVLYSGIHHQGCRAVAFDLRTRKKERWHPSHLLAARAQQAAVTGKADVGWLWLRCAACGPQGGEGVSPDAMLAQWT
jgi:hypothetical protein